MTTYRVGYGGQGYWHNQTCTTRQDAEQFFEQEVGYLRTCYPGMRTHETEGGPSEAGMIKSWTIVNIRKDGTPGKLRQTVRLYAIEVHA